MENDGEEYSIDNDKTSSTQSSSDLDTASHSNSDDSTECESSTTTRNKMRWMDNIGPNRGMYFF